MNIIPSRLENLPPNTKSVLTMRISDEEKKDNKIFELNGKECLNS